MPKYSERSLRELSSCDVLLQKIFIKVIKGYNCTILEGHRGKSLQNEYFRTGKSKVKWPDSEHNDNPSKALDGVPYPIDWNDTKRFYYFAGYVKGIANSMGIAIRWGGDWDSDNDLNDQTFFDLVHFELKE